MVGNPFGGSPDFIAGFRAGISACYTQIATLENVLHTALGHFRGPLPDQPRAEGDMWGFPRAGYPESITHGYHCVSCHLNRDKEAFSVRQRGFRADARRCNESNTIMVTIRAV